MRSTRRMRVTSPTRILSSSKWCCRKCLPARNSRRRRPHTKRTCTLKEYSPTSSVKSKYLAFLKTLAEVSYGEFRRKGRKRANPAGWGAEVEEENDGAFLAAAEDGGEDGK